MRHTVRLSTQHKVLVLDRDPDARVSIARDLRDSGFSVFEASGMPEASRLIESEAPEVLVVDLGPSESQAMDHLRALRTHNAPGIVVLTEPSAAHVAERAVGEGAQTFLVKPANAMALAACVRVAAERRRIDSVRPASIPPMQTTYTWRSEVMQELEERVARLRDADCAVLVIGETGTGKSALARALHDRSHRAGRPFVDVDCAGLRPERADVELFGETESGLFELADSGSIFFDNVGDLDLAVQPKVLRAVEEKRYRRQGDLREHATSARVIASTSQDLLEEVAEKRFRADLYYRVSAATLQLPALRDRRADIVPFAEHLLSQLAPGTRIDPAAAAQLLDHDWPGNLRELKNVIESVALLGTNGIISKADLKFDAPSVAPRVSSSRTMRTVASEESAAASGMRPKTLDELEREHIRRALEAEGGHVESAAKLLGIPRSTLYQKLKNYGWGSGSRAAATGTGTTRR